MAMSSREETMHIQPGILQAYHRSSRLEVYYRGLGQARAERETAGAEKLELFTRVSMEKGIETRNPRTGKAR
jgi:hypothetical protein